MKITKIYAFVLLIFAGALTSCMEEPDFYKVWDGLEVEFDLSTLPSNGPQQNFIRTSDTQVDNYNVQVNLVGAPQANDITVAIEVDESSTAIAGVHFNLNSSTVTIPAGENVVQLPVEVLTGNIDPTETPNLVLRITSSDVKVSVNYNQVTVRIRVICPSDLEGTYSVFHEELNFGDGSGGVSRSLQNHVVASHPNVTFTETGAGVYTVSDISFGSYPGESGYPVPTGSISDSCGQLTGSPSNADAWGDPFIISGQVNEDDTITLTWGNTWGDGGTVILTAI